MHVEIRPMRALDFVSLIAYCLLELHFTDAVVVTVLIIAVPKSALYVLEPVFLF